MIPPPVYPILERPERVLTALQLAYAARDSIGYRKLFDYFYQGKSTDLTDNSIETFANADEVKHIQALARVSTITSVTLNLGPESSWDRQSSDDLSNPDWAVIQISGSSFFIEVNDTQQTTWQVSGAGETFTFRFKPSTPETSSPTDTLWNIVGWEETRSQ